MRISDWSSDVCSSDLPEAMYSAFAEAVARARAGEGPTLLECMTFRIFGHNFGDDDSYIPKEQKPAAMKADAVPRLRARQIADAVATEAALAAAEAESVPRTSDAIEHAIASTWTEPTDIPFHIFAKANAASAQPGKRRPNT